MIVAVGLGAVVGVPVGINVSSGDEHAANAIIVKRCKYRLIREII